MRLFKYRWVLLSMAIVLTACQQTPTSAPPSAKVKIGNPYIVDGKTYYPAYDPTYDKIGEASWYGPGFHGKYTANGEIFNQNDLTAAHPTLPMPSLVRVTNLENGRSLIVRINDRGPFKSNRIIDMSKKSAELLGIRSTSRVRVQYLNDETEDYLTGLQNTGKPMDMIAYNDKAERAKDASVTQSTEPADDSSGQIVESTTSSSHAGQTVSDAAPVLTVSSGELAHPPAVSPAPDNTNTTPSGKMAFIKDAMADESVPVATPVSDPVAAADPEVVHVDQTIRPPRDQEMEIAPATKSAKPPFAAASATGSAAHGHYIIQAGSFAAEDNAHKLSDRVSGVAKTLVDKVEMGGKTWWRVRVGPFSDKATAEAALTKVRAADVPDARLVHI